MAVSGRTLWPHGAPAALGAAAAVFVAGLVLVLSAQPPAAALR
jgi:hypothetical protein